MVKASATIIPIHDGMFLSIHDIPDEKKHLLTTRRINGLKKILAGYSFESIKRILKKSGYSDRVSVGKIQTAK